jgi:hypothetical protein
MTKRVMRVPSVCPPWKCRDNLLCQISKNQKPWQTGLRLIFSCENTSELLVSEAFNEVMRTYKYAPTSDLKLASPSEVHQAIKGISAGKASGPNSFPNKVLSHPPKYVVTFLTNVFDAVFCRQFFHQHGNMFSWYPY